MTDTDFSNDYEGYKKWKMNVHDWGRFFEIGEAEAGEISYQFRVLKLETKNLRVLEIGFGSGKFLKWATSQGCKIEGVEIQDHLIASAHKKEIKAYKSIFDVEGPYDLIVGFDVLEHMSVQQLKEFFFVASGLLTPEGKMFFRFPNGDSYAGLAAQNGDSTHLTSIGQSKLRQLIDPSGLKIDIFTSRAEYRENKLKSIIIKLFRAPFIRLYGFNIPYFFSGSVVTVISKN